MSMDPENEGSRCYFIIYKKYVIYINMLHFLSVKKLMGGRKRKGFLNLNWYTQH